MSAPQARIKAALDLAAKGFFIFALKPGAKEPVPGSAWSFTKTRDPEAIRQIWQTVPNANYGVCPGPHGVIIDLDKATAKKPDKEDGEAALCQLESDQPLDEWISAGGFQVKTPSNGKHIYLRTDSPLGNAHGLPKGIDVRGAAGYVVGPECEIVDGLCEANDTAGTYKIEIDEPPRKIPGWMLFHIGEKRRRKDDQTAALDLDLEASIAMAREYLFNHEPAIQGSNGNDTTYKVAAGVRDFGISYEKCLELMTETGGWNERCSPPWSQDELAAGPVGNAYKYAQNAPGDKAALWEIHGDVTDPGNLSEYISANDDIVIGDDLPLSEDEFAYLRSITKTAEEVEHKPLTTDMVIPDWLPTKGFVGVIARRGSGKTTSLCDLGMHVACDMSWHGIPVMEDWAVVYIAGEDDDGASKMIKGWIKEYDRRPEPGRFFLMERTMNLINTEECLLWARYFKKILNRRRTILIVDTWQRATAEASQIDDEKMNKAIQNIEGMARVVNGPAIVACHPPKDDSTTIMGSGVVENASAALWLFDPNFMTGSKIVVTRIKGAPDKSYVNFRYKDVPLGVQDRWGREMTGRVPVKIGGSGMPITDAMTQMNAAIRHAYADLIINEIWKMENSHNDHYEKNPGSYFGIKDTAARILALTEDDEFMKKLRAAGETGEFNPSKLMSRLNDLFRVNANPETFDNGNALIYQKTFQVAAASKAELEIGVRPEDL